MRAIAECLFNGDRDRLPVNLLNLAVQSTASAAAILDAKQADIGTLGQNILQWIAVNQPRVDSERVRVGSVDESGSPNQDACPGPSLCIRRTDKYERQLRKERFVIPGQVIPDHPLAKVL